MATRKNQTANAAAAAAPKGDTALAQVSVTEQVFADLKAFTVGQVRVHAAQLELNTTREKTTARLIHAGMIAGTVEVFDAARDRLYAEVRANKGNIAANLNAEKDAEGNYKIPKSLQVYIVEVRNTLARGASFTDDKGQPLSFGKIRAANKKAREDAAEATAQAEMSPDDKARHRVAALFADINGAAAKMNGADLVALLATVERFHRALAETLSPDITVPNAEAPAEAIARAA
jgi:hypothetical protein